MQGMLSVSHDVMYMSIICFFFTSKISRMQFFLLPSLDVYAVYNIKYPATFAAVRVCCNFPGNV